MVAEAAVRGNAGEVITAIPAPKVHGSFAGGIGRITVGRLLGPECRGHYRLTATNPARNGRDAAGKTRRRVLDPSLENLAAVLEQIAMDALPLASSPLPRRRFPDTDQLRPTAPTGPSSRPGLFIFSAPSQAVMCIFERATNCFPVGVRLTTSICPYGGHTARYSLPTCQ